jgi:hypothetical protein
MEIRWHETERAIANIVEVSRLLGQPDHDDHYAE